MSKPDTDTIDRLFLELSQFTTATTGKELRYEKALKAIMERHEDDDGTTSMWMRLIAKDALQP